GGSPGEEDTNRLEVAADLVDGRPALVLHVHQQRIGELVHRHALGRGSPEALGACLTEPLPELLPGDSGGLAAGFAVLRATDAVLDPVAGGPLALVDATVSAAAHEATGCALPARAVNRHRSVCLR